MEPIPMTVVSVDVGYGAWEAVDWCRAEGTAKGLVGEAGCGYLLKSTR